MYTKIYNQIFDSTLAADYVTRHVFMDLLVLCDWDGVVDMTVDVIARRTNMPEKMIVAAIAKLMKPDPQSRSDIEEGRRLVLIDSHRNWGWQIVNYQHYRNLRDEETRRDYMRDYMRKRRVNSVNSVNSGKHLLANTDTEVNTEVNTKAKERISTSPVAFNSTEAAMGYCHTFSVVGKNNYELIRQAIELEFTRGTNPRGETVQDIADRMIERRHQYEDIAGKKFEYPPVSFITSGIWKVPAKWKNKPVSSFDRSMELAEQAIQEIENGQKR